jgi:hypothetical protein
MCSRLASSRGLDDVNLLDNGSAEMVVLWQKTIVVGLCELVGIDETSFISVVGNDLFLSYLYL